MRSATRRAHQATRSGHPERPDRAATASRQVAKCPLPIGDPALAEAGSRLLCHALCRSCQSLDDPYPPICSATWSPRRPPGAHADPGDLYAAARMARRSGRAAVTSAIPSSVALRVPPAAVLLRHGMSDPSGPDVIPDITPGEQPWLHRVRYRRSRGPVRWCPRRRRSARTSRSEAVLAGAKPAEPAQKMNGTSILVERLYTG